MIDVLAFSLEPITDARDPANTMYLRDLWKNEHCAIFFLRRLGCPICRSYIRMFEAVREEYEQKGVRMICLSFEGFGEGSDADRGFEKGGFWNGPVYVIKKDVYAALFGRKTFLNGFFGLLDMNKEALERSKGTAGNLKGDGFQLGGQCIVEKGGRILLDHRQKAFGDDAPLHAIVKILDDLV